jgi:hypothetical protein
MNERACTSGKCQDGCCERVGPETPPDTQIDDATNSHDDADHRDIPDLTSETAEPEPSSGDATSPINLTDKAGENPALYPESYCRLEKVYAELSMTTTEPTSKVAFPTTHSGRATIDVW